MPQVACVSTRSIDSKDYIAITLQEFTMSSLTIRNHDESVKAGLRLRAARQAARQPPELSAS